MLVGHRQPVAAVGTTELVFLAICTLRFRPTCQEDVEDAAALG
jgi:hypothetical protein